MMMVKGTPVSTVTDKIIVVLGMTNKLGEDIDQDKYNWPDDTTLGRWRYGMTHVCQVHIDMELI